MMNSNSFDRRQFLRLALAVPWAFKAAAAENAADLNSQLLPVLRSSGLPAIAAAVMKNGKIVAKGAVGIRKAGALAPVTFEDKFHLGSNTKAMTATLFAMLAEQGKVRWNQTLGEIFPERVSRMHASYSKVTIEMLLTHRSGAPNNGHDYGAPGQSVTAQRMAYLDSVVTKTPYTVPGTQYVYSNAGYIIAGTILERITGKPWEELIETRLFRPLGMRRAGFGPPSKPNQVDQPWGHVFRGGRFEPSYNDNPAALGPAGTVHCALSDYLKFADFHASLGARPEGLLQKSSLLQLQTPQPGWTYAMGWGTGNREWARGRILTHMGSNNKNYFIVWIAPEIEFSLAVATNAAGPKVAEAIDSISSQLVTRFAKA